MRTATSMRSSCAIGPTEGKDGIAPPPWKAQTGPFGLEIRARSRHDPGMTRSLRPELHVLTDPRLPPGRSLAELVAAALAGGADVIQLRDKAATPDEIAAMIRSVLPLVRHAGRRLVVNDHWTLARNLGADGAHVGAADAPVVRVRRECPPPFVVGASARTVDAARSAAEAGADYLGVGPVFSTSSKPDAPGAVGAGRVAELSRAVSASVIGIGGIDASNAADVIRAGAAGVAVLSAACLAADPEAAIREIRTRIDAEAGRARLAESPPGC